MGFDKEIPSKVSEYKIFTANSTEELVKVASGDVDVPEGFEFDPDYFYIWIRIISSGEYYGPNKNGDYFPTDELLSSYETFNEAHVFKNHENKQIEKAIGRIFSVRWNPIMKCVEIFKGIDRKLAPEIVRGFEKGFLTDVSMGCKVPYTVCSVCGNKARKQTEFCNHVKNYRMQYLGNGERVFEINYEPKFHDSSVVLNGAERVAKALVIFDQPKDSPLVSSFQKAASVRGVSSFTKLSDHEMEKVAHHKEHVIHPLLREPSVEKVASDNPYLTKIAELEKEVTGKLLNIVSSPSEVRPKAAEQLVQIIKFLTEKRIDEDSMKSIAASLASISKSESIPVSKAFSAFISVAELMGIELFPTELHTLLCELTNAKIDESLELTDSEGEELYPSEFAKGVTSTMQATEQLPEFKDTADLFNSYNELPFYKDEFKSNPFDFLEGMANGRDLEGEAPVRTVKFIRQILEPFMPMRSHHPEFLLPRLSVVLGGHSSVIGGREARRDMNIMTNPGSLGDLLATIAYKNYQNMRPTILMTNMVKSAMYFDTELEKVAAEGGKSKGIKRRHIAVAAIPAVYGASAFQKSRKEDGKQLSDVESFVAKNPGVIAGGAIIAGKPLSRGIANGLASSKKGVTNVIDKTKKNAEEIGERTKNGFNKLTSEEYTELVKIADSLNSGQFNAFDENMLKKFAGTYNLTAEQTAITKMATLLEIGGMDKEAQVLLDSKDIPKHIMGVFLKEASEYASEEMEKAAGDFVNTLVLDGLIDKRNLSTTTHGRLLDAFVFKKLGDLGKEKTPKEPFTVGSELNV